MGPRTGHRRTRRSAGLLLAGALLSTACNGGEPGADPTTTPAPTTTAPAATTTIVPAPSPLLDTMAPLVLAPDKTWPPQAREIFEAYVRAEQAVVKARLEPVNPDHPELSATHTGELLEATRQKIHELRESRRAAKPPTRFSIRPIRFTKTSETKMIFHACYQSDESVVSLDDGAVVAGGLSSVPREIGMEIVSSRWVMGLRSALDEWRGKTCDDVFGSAS